MTGPKMGHGRVIKHETVGAFHSKINYIYTVNS